MGLLGVIKKTTRSLDNGSYVAPVLVTGFRVLRLDSSKGVI